MVHEKLDFDYIFKATHDAGRFVKANNRKGKISTISSNGHVQLDLGSEGRLQTAATPAARDHVNQAYTEDDEEEEAAAEGNDGFTSF